MLYFAYGSNMSRAVMRRHAPAAVPLGVARLAGYRFVIAANGYATVEPARGTSVHGVLWRLSPRDRARLDAWEGVGCGQYRACSLAVACAFGRRSALVYLARCGHGRAKPGYMEVVIAAAREWQLPKPHIGSLVAFLPRRPAGLGGRRLDDFFGEFFHGGDP